VRPARWRSICSAMWCVFTTARSTPASTRVSSAWSINGRPATSTSGLGRPLLAWARRVPFPAARTIAVLGIRAWMRGFEVEGINLAPERAAGLVADCDPATIAPDRAAGRQGFAPAVARDAGGAGDMPAFCLDGPIG